MQLPEQMYVNYVLRRLEDLEQLRISLQNNDVSAFKRIGHQIKGNAASFGFDDLVILGNQMNDMVPENLAAQGPSLVEQFKAWITEKKGALKIP